MIPRLRGNFSSWFNTTASSSTPSQAQLRAMSVKELVEKAIKDNQVAIFSKTWCPYCRKAKELFASKFPNVKTEILELDNRDDGADIQNYLFEKTGQRSVPNIFVAQQHIGGCDDTMDAYKAGKLVSLLKV